jgi:hypothetical protein
MSERPRLIFVSPRFLFPVHSGGKLRTVQLLRGLKDGHFHVTLASPAPRGAHRHFRNELASVADRFVYWPQPGRGLLFHLGRLRHLVSALPVSVASDRSAGGRRAVVSLLDRKPDVVVLDYVHAAVLAPRRLDIPSLLIAHHVEAELVHRHVTSVADPWRRTLWEDQHRKMVRFERDALRRVDCIIAGSPQDRARLVKDYGVARVATVFPHPDPTERTPGRQLETLCIETAHEVRETRRRGFEGAPGMRQVDAGA